MNVMNTFDSCGCAQRKPNCLEEWPENGLESVPNCPICGTQKRILLHADLTDRVFGVASGRWNLFRCLQCESAWLDPRPTRETISEAYSSYYTHDQIDHPIVRRKGILRSFLHDAMNDYRNRRYNLRLQPANKLGRWLIPLLPSLRAAVDAECRHLPKPPSGGGRLLDVGFGNGGFLKIATEMGWNAEGIDFDPKAVEIARLRGLNVRCASAEDLKGGSGQYDIITLCHVIEHVHDPIRLLVELHRLLKPNGLLWLDTPNLKSKGYGQYGRNWRGLEPPRHLILFNILSLKKSLKSVGFVDFKQQWRGLSVFDVFPVSEAMANGTDIGKASRDGKPPLSEIVAELIEMYAPEKREFITLIVRKSL